ncbi:hypothetical protein ACU8NW_10490 [Rhizobium leguminosarum]
MGAGIADGVARRLVLVAAEIVEDNDIAAIEGVGNALAQIHERGRAIIAGLPTSNDVESQAKQKGNPLAIQLEADRR